MTTADSAVRTWFLDSLVLLIVVFFPFRTRTEYAHTRKRSMFSIFISD